MKTKKTFTFTIATCLVAIITTLVILSASRRAKAQDTLPPPQPDRISFGMVGITQGQTIRVNVSNVTATNDSNYPPGPTRVAIIVVNSHGDPIRNRDGSPARRVLMLDRGDSAFLDLNADDLQFPPGPTRLQLRAIVTVNPPPQPESEQPPPVGDRIVPSVEIFNNNNPRTVVFVGNPGVIRGFNPQPDPPL